MKMSHEAEDLNRVKLWNLVQGGNNRGNEWWIFDHRGTPIETWSTESRARTFLRALDDFKALHNVPPCMLFRCMPGIGFIRQES